MNTEIKITGYEDVKQGLLNSGFKMEGDTFVKEDKHVQTMNINGQVFQQEHVTSIKILYIGEGAVDDDPIHGFAIYTNDHHNLDVWCSDFEGFIRLTK